MTTATAHLLDSTMISQLVQKSAIRRYLVAEGSNLDFRVNKVHQLDNSGEPCEHCQMALVDVEAQAYARNAYGEDVFVEACLPCMVPALLAASVEEYSTVTVEVEL